MKRTGKWIDGILPTQPAADAARPAIKLRLKLVASYLPQAAKRADEDPEHVHQLRVATRRAMAALETFADYLPAKRLKKMKKRLRQVRRAAGDARDLDVLLERLEGMRSEVAGPQWEQLLCELRERRTHAQPAIRQVNAELKAWKFDRRLRDLVRRVRWRGAKQGAGEYDGPTFLDAARQSLTPTVETFFAAMGGPLDDPAAMHQCRILGKKLRYAMELFAGAFPTPFRDELYPQIERVQVLLGQINDHAAARVQFTALLDAAEDEARRYLMHELLAVEARLLEAARADFFGWWSNDRAAQLAGQFADFLGALRVISAERSAAVG